MSLDSSPLLPQPEPDESWQRLKLLFHEGVQRPQAQRPAFVEGLAAADQELANRLATLLASYEASATFLEIPALGVITGSHLPEELAPGPGLGDVIDGKYRLDARLGEGGMGVVYLATHLGLGRQCAVKVIRETARLTPTALDCFRREARALGRLQHPNIVAVTDYGVDANEGALPYLVMEYLEGVTLARECTDRGQVPIVQALPLLEGIASAVDYAHHQGILHGDLKPSNIFLCRGAAGPGSVKIVDFGLARLGASAWPDGLAEGVAGTPSCMPPEMTSGDGPTPAGDIYAFGVVAFRLLVGRFPFEGSIHHVLAAQRTEHPPLPSGLNRALPTEVDAPLLAALDKRAELRPTSALDVVAQIQRAVDRADRRVWRAREAPRRVLIAAIVAAFVAAISWPIWTIFPAEQLERRSIDARLAAVTSRAPNSSIVLVVVDEGTLAGDARPLTDRADEFGETLQRLFDSGARAVAVDFLLPASWSESRPFSTLILRNADKLTLAALSSSTGQVIGPECLNPLTAAALGPDVASRLFAFVNRESDPDGLHRRGRVWYPDEAGSRRSTWAVRAVETFGGERNLTSGVTRRPVEQFWIDHSIDAGRFERISWKDLSRALERERSLFRERLVLVGGEYLGSGDEQHLIPAQEGEPPGVSGLVLQALLVDTILARFPIREVSAVLMLLVVAIALMGVALALLWLARIAISLVAVAVGAGLYVLAVLAAFQQWHVLLPVAGPLLSVSIGVGLALLMRRVLPAVPPRAPERS